MDSIEDPGTPLKSVGQDSLSGATFSQTIVFPGLPSTPRTRTRETAVKTKTTRESTRTRTGSTQRTTLSTAFSTTSSPATNALSSRSSTTGPTATSSNSAASSQTLAGASSRNGSTSSGLSSGDIAAAVVVPIVVVALAAIALFLWYRRRRTAQQTRSGATDAHSGYGESNEMQQTYGSGVKATSAQQQPELRTSEAGPPLAAAGLDAPSTIPYKGRYYRAAADQQRALHPESSVPSLQPNDRSIFKSPFADPSPGPSFAASLGHDFSPVAADRTVGDDAASSVAGLGARAPAAGLDAGRVDGHGTHDDDARSVVSAQSDEGDERDANDEDVEYGTAQVAVGRSSLSGASVINMNVAGPLAKASGGNGESNN